MLWKAKMNSLEQEAEVCLQTYWGLLEKAVFIITSAIPLPITSAILNA